MDVGHDRAINVGQPFKNKFRHCYVYIRRLLGIAIYTDDSGAQTAQGTDLSDSERLNYRPRILNPDQIQQQKNLLTLNLNM